MTLGQKQELFSELLGEFLTWLYANGYKVRFGEAERYPWVASAMEWFGRGISNSNHCRKLAADLNIFRNEKYLQSRADLEFVGAYWKALHPFCRWGGDFSRPDVYHFSVEHEGVQ